VEETEADKLDRLQFQMGPPAGRLALALDGLTGVIASVGQHRIYCRVEKGPRAGEGSLDIEAILRELAEIKRLITATMGEIREDRPGYPASAAR
jgi:hypothetical protein